MVVNKDEPVPIPVAEQKLRALCALSDMKEPLDISALTAIVEKAPDPETAVRGVLHTVITSSETLTRKWRSTIIDLWARQHPHVPLVPELKLSASDVSGSDIVRDAHAYITELEKRPAHLTKERGEWLLEPNEVVRLARVLPSLSETDLFAVENEWGCMTARRLRALLLATRLVRAVKGQLIPVHSRVTRFRSLPPTQQFFVLWHADAYHVPWVEFGGLWSSYLRVMQEYLPLFWEALGTIQAGQTVERTHFCWRVLDVFTPLWEEEGLLEAKRGNGFALQVVQHHALPTIIDRYLVRDILERHGLVVMNNELSVSPSFTWTESGALLIPAEAGQHLPCGNDFLS